MRILTPNYQLLGVQSDRLPEIPRKTLILCGYNDLERVDENLMIDRKHDVSRESWYCERGAKKSN